MAKSYRNRQASRRDEGNNKGRRRINFHGLKWMGVGVVLGVSLILWGPSLSWQQVTNKVKGYSLALLQTANKEAKTEKPSRVADAKKAVSPSFDFYTLLPEMKVEVANNKANTKVVAAQPHKEPVQKTEATKEIISPKVDQPVLVAGIKENKKEVKDSKVKPEVVVAQETKLPEGKKSFLPFLKREKYSVQVAAFKNFSDADAAKTQLLVSGYPVSLQTVPGTNGQPLHRLKMGPYKTKQVAERDRQKLLAMNFKNTIVITEE